jgi:hypothetical protein
MEDLTRMTPLNAGSAQQVVDGYVGVRELFGDFQR